MKPPDYKYEITNYNSNYYPNGLSFFIFFLLLATNWNLNAKQEDSSATNMTAATKGIISEGCQPDYGYFENDSNPNCYPLDSIGKPPTRDEVFCAALGCPYNPPDLD